MPLPNVQSIKDTYRGANQLSRYIELASRCHAFIEEHKVHQLEAGGYDLYEVNGSDLRPIHNASYLAAFEPDEIAEFLNLFIDPSGGRDGPQRALFLRFLYTIQQSVGAYLDATADSQTGRKVAGEFFQGLINSMFASLSFNVFGGNISFDVETNGVREPVRLSFDIIVKHRDLLHGGLEPPCMVCGVKTTTKDRMNMFFVDRYLYEHTHEHRPRFTAIVLNDVQRKRARGVTTGISYTFLPGHYRLYEHVFGALDGFYYIVPPAVVAPRIDDEQSVLKSLDVLVFDEISDWLRVDA